MLLVKIHRAIIWFISSPFKTNQIRLLLRDTSACLLTRFQSGLHNSGASSSLSSAQTLLSLTRHKIDGLLKVLDLQGSIAFSRRPSTRKDLSDKWNHVIYGRHVAAIEFSWEKSYMFVWVKLGQVLLFLRECNEVQLCFKCSPSAFVATETLCSAHSKTGSTDVTSACKSGHLSDGECKRRCLYHNPQSRFTLWRSHCCALEMPFNIHRSVS